MIYNEVENLAEVWLSVWKRMLLLLSPCHVSSPWQMWSQRWLRYHHVQRLQGQTLLWDHHVESKEIMVDSASQLRRTKDKESGTFPQHHHHTHNHEHQLQRKFPSSPITEEAPRRVGIVWKEPEPKNSVEMKFMSFHEPSTLGPTQDF